MATFDKNKVPLVRYVRRRSELASGFASIPGSEVVVVQVLILGSFHGQYRSRYNQEPTTPLLKELVLNSSSNKVAFAKAVESHFISSGGPFELSRMESICLSLAEEDAKSANHHSKFWLPQSFWLRVLNYLGHFRASLVIYCPLDATRPRMKDFSAYCLIRGGGRGFRPDLPEEDRVEWPQRVEGTKYYQTHKVEWSDICLRAAVGIGGAKEKKRRFLEECEKELNEPKEVQVASASAGVRSKSAPPPPVDAPMSNLRAAAAPARTNKSAVPAQFSTPRRSDRLTAAASTSYVNAGNGTPPKKKAKTKEDEGSAPAQPAPPLQKEDQIKDSKGGAASLNQPEDHSGEKKIPPAPKPSAELLSLQSDLKIAKAKQKLLEKWLETYRSCLDAQGVVLVNALR
jgi:hypothetical protein